MLDRLGESESEVTQSCPTLCYLVDCSPSGSSIHGILQARILEWVSMPSSWGSSRPRDKTHILMSPAMTGGFFTTSATWEAQEMLAVKIKCKMCLVSEPKPR